MRVRRGMAIPMAALAVAGGIALGGCGGSSNEATTPQQTQNASATPGSDAAMKHDHGDAMKGSDHAMKHDHGGAMKNDDHGDSMHEDAMKNEG